jgi:hypothetical protein
MVLRQADIVKDQADAQILTLSQQQKERHGHPYRLEIKLETRGIEPLYPSGG